MSKHLHRAGKDSPMSAIRRAAILKLASAAYEMKLDVMNGVIRQDENGQWQVGDYDLATWLAVHEGEEMV